MNARAGDAFAIPEFILGDRQLHVRFAMAIELLARIVMANPRPLTTAALSEALGQPPRAVRQLLTNLQRAGLLQQDERNRDSWSCSCEPGAITLADVYRSVAAAQAETSRKKKQEPVAAGDMRGGAQQSVELLLMQATMAINQVVLQHLQAFDLGRLSALKSPALPFPAPRRAYS
ncbi:MAG TPA: Rrf2 family transcriptional regulator [Noviherbaspirillum sp.]|uniref:Rrf2 family transcriptional regulator n=1 Tax=Noviherbaspirillum sp. TaxID=1926288 RepID=UPI002D340CB4|nr:Rrf2 family transcriptional regulator [Noviherbaspirillum sp.]HYD97400.1 Rrf2 family transcriptional regulator [Noviherbaspirillum sp.]